jgi:phage regulator Rha-like protein
MDNQKGTIMAVELVTLKVIENKIYVIRGKKVMLDRDLAALYEVETKVLNQAVKRNFSRFPEDFMFQLTSEEAEALRSQFVTSNIGRGGRRYFPYAFTENGVAMLSTVLSSERAIQINIQIMRAFVRMKNIVADNTDLRKAIEHIERRLDVHDQQIKIAFAALKSILQPDPKPETPPQLPPKEYSPDKGKKMGFGKASLPVRDRLPHAVQQGGTQTGGKR